MSIYILHIVPLLEKNQRKFDSPSYSRHKVLSTVTTGLRQALGQSGFVTHAVILMAYPGASEETLSAN